MPSVYDIADYNANPICKYPGCGLAHIRQSPYCREHSLQCKYPGCVALRRRVQAAKYCDEHHALLTAIHNGKGPHDERCAVCGETFRYYGQGPTTVPLMCQGCRRGVGRVCKRWGLHHVPIPTQLAWLSDPRCYVCDGRISLAPSRYGKESAAVDHDHRCCPGGTSCGACVRGLTHADCNQLMGQIERALALVGSQRLGALVRDLSRG